jgi:hypothetical protein
MLRLVYPEKKEITIGCIKAELITVRISSLIIYLYKVSDVISQSYTIF